MPVLYGPNPKLNESPKDEANKMCLAGITEGKYQSHFKSRIVDEFAKNPDANYLKERSYVPILFPDSDHIFDYYDYYTLWVDWSIMGALRL